MAVIADPTLKIFKVDEQQKDFTGIKKDSVTKQELISALEDKRKVISDFIESLAKKDSAGNYEKMWKPTAETVEKFNMRWACLYLLARDVEDQSLINGFNSLNERLGIVANGRNMQAQISIEGRQPDPNMKKQDYEKNSIAGRIVEDVKFVYDKLHKDDVDPAKKTITQDEANSRADAICEPLWDKAISVRFSIESNTNKQNNFNTNLNNDTEKTVSASRNKPEVISFDTTQRKYDFDFPKQGDKFNCWILNVQAIFDWFLLNYGEVKSINSDEKLNKKLFEMAEKLGYIKKPEEGTLFMQENLFGAIFEHYRNYYLKLPVESLDSKQDIKNKQNVGDGYKDLRKKAAETLNDMKLGYGNPSDIAELLQVFISEVVRQKNLKMDIEIVTTQKPNQNWLTPEGNRGELLGEYIADSVGMRQDTNENGQIWLSDAMPYSPALFTLGKHVYMTISDKECYDPLSAENPKSISEVVKDLTKQKADIYLKLSRKD